MIAAIYARKSTDQSGVADAEKSVTRQIEHASDYAVGKGWTVALEHIYSDDGISGAEFANRPGFLRLMNALKPTPPFQALVMSEESRLGREAIETAYALKQLVQAGVRIFFYLEDRERTLDSPTDKVMLSLTTFADELERERARQRTYDAMLRKARAGHVTGGRCFGYDNIRVDGHVERRVNETESEVVRRIFRLSADGHGMKAIAKQLNAEGAPSPRAQQGRSQSWAPSSVRTVLFRDLYRGVITWNRTRKRDRWGQKHQTDRPECEWIDVPAPHLRVVDEKLWEAAHARLSAARTVYLKGTRGQRFGRPPIGSPSQYLLTNLAECGCCGGSLKVRTRNHRNFRAKFYGCSGYHDRGRTVCSNGADIPMEDANGIVLEALLDDVLTPDVLDEAVAEALQTLLGDEQQSEADRQRLEQQIRRVEGERARLVQAVATGGELGSLLSALRDRESRLDTLRAACEGLRSRKQNTRPLDRRRVSAELRELAKHWRDVLAGEPAHARPILTKLLVGRVSFTPLEDPKRWELRGRGTISGLFQTILPLAARGESRSYDGSTQSIRRTTLTRMAMGTRETDHPPLWIATSDLPTSPGHPFYARLTTLLDGHHFDRFVEGLCARFYAPVMGRPSLAPGRYFRLLLVGSFEGIDSERGMAWRATDSLAVRSFLRLAVDEAPPDHSTIARTRRLIDLETHRTVFTWVQQRLVEAGRLTGKTIAIDATTLEANAAMRSIVRRDTGESSQAFLAGLATASGVETPTREALARLDRKRKKKTSNTDWTHPHDPDAKVTKMKDGRTHLAHKAEHAVDMETGAIVAVTLHGADVGDTTTIIETAIAATEQVEDAQANVDDPQALDEIVGDKGYHSNQTLIDLDAVGIRSYVSEPDRGRRDWSKAPEAQAPVSGNRRRMRGRRGRRLMRQRGERIERSFAHLYDTGGMRRTHLRGHTNILKRLLIHAGGFNLGLVMRHLIGIGTPRGLQGRVAAVRATLSVHMGVVRGRLTPISSSHRLIPAVRGRLASLTTFAVNSSAAITCTTGC